MADNVIDSLSIEIDSDIAGAKKNIGKLRKTLEELKVMYESVGNVSGNVSEKLRDLASGMNAIANINADGVKAATAAMRGFMKLDFSSMSAIPAGFADNIIALADGVNQFGMQIDGGMVKNAVNSLKKIYDFDFQGLSANVNKLDPTIGAKVRAFMDSFKSISGDFTVSDTLASMQSLFQIDFSGFSNFMAEASKGMPNFAAAIQQFSAACASPEFSAAIERLSHLANVDLGGLAQLSMSGKKVVPDVSAQVDKETAETEASMSRLKAVLLTDVSSQFSFIKTSLVELGGIGRSAINALGNGFRKLSTRIKKSNGFLSKFIRSIGRIALYRSVRFLLSQIAKGFKEGTDNLYQYSKAIDGQFAKSMDMISTALLYFRNSVAAAAAPTINKLAPAIDALIDKVVECLNWFNELTAKLTRASTWTRALKYPKEYAEATKDASKALKDFQMGFDELNVINDSGSNSAADAIDYSKMFTEMKVDMDFEPWADAFRKAIEESDFYGAGQILGNKLKETFANLPSDEWGSVLAEKLNNAIAFADGFLSTHPFDEMGQKIGEFLNGSLLHIEWGTLAETFSNGLNSILTGVDTFITTLESYEIWKKIGEGLDGLKIAETLSNIGTLVYDMLVSLTDGFNGFIDGVPWEKLGSELFEGITSFIFDHDWSNIGANIMDALISIGQGLLYFASGFVSEISPALSDSLKHIGDWIDDHPEAASFITGVSIAIIALSAAFNTGFVGSVAGGLAALGGINVTLGVIIAGLASWVYVITEIRDNWDDITDVIEENSGLLGFISGWLDSAREDIEEFFDMGSFGHEWQLFWETVGETVFDEFDALKKGVSSVKNTFERFGEWIYDETHLAQDAAYDTDKAWFESKNKLIPIIDTLKGTFTEFGDNWRVTTEDVKSKLVNLVSNFQSKFETIKATVADKLTNAKSTLTTKMTEMKTAVSYNVGEMKDSWITGFNDIKLKATTKLDELKKSFSEWDGLEKFKDHWSDAKRIVADKVVEMKNSIADTIGNIPAAIRGKANDIWTAIEQLINGMIEGFNHFADNISEKFSFTIPNIPGVTGAGQSFGLTIPRIPPLTLGKFENGGFPNIGELFLANENGVAEMVGRIGNRTAVANNDQIVDAVAAGVAQAVQSVLLNAQGNDDRNINIYLDGKQIAATVEKYQKQRGVSIYGGGVVNA